MNRTEFKRLNAYHHAAITARTHAPGKTQQGKRNVKGRAKGVGQWLKDSRVLNMKQI